MLVWKQANLSSVKIELLAASTVNRSINCPPRS